MTSVLIFFYLLQIALDIKNKSPFLLFTLSVFSVVVIPHVFVTKPGEDISTYVYDEVTSYILVFQFIYLINCILLSGKLRFNSWNYFDEIIIEKSNIIFIGVVNFVSILFFVYGISKFNITLLIYADWWSVVHSNSSITLVASYLSYASSSLAMMCMITNKFRIIPVLYCLFFVLFTVFILKTRGYLISFLTPVFLYYLFSTKFSNLSKFKNIFFSVFFILSLFIFTRMVRHGGDISGLFEMSFGDFNELFVSATSDGSEFLLIKSLYLFVDRGMEFLPEEFGGFYTLRRLLFFFLPTGLFDLKPMEFSYIMYEVYYGSGNGNGLSLHPTIIGEAFANGGLLGVVLYPILIVWLFSFISVVLSKNKVSYVYIGPVCVLCLFLARGAIYNGFVFFIGSCVILATLSKVLKFKI